MAEEGKIKKLFPGKSLPALLATLVLVILAIGVVFAANMLWPKLKHVSDEVKKDPDIAWKAHLKIGEGYMSIGKYDEAFENLQNAMDCARTPESRVEVGLAIGQVLLLKARTVPFPHALMARHYFEAVLNLEKRPEIRFKVFREMIRTAALLKDVKGIVYASEEAKKLSGDANSALELLMIQLDAQIDAGSWGDVRKLLAEAESTIVDARRWGHEYGMRRAMAMEKVLLDNAWFAEWKKDFPDVPVETARAGMFTNTLTAFNMLNGSGVQRMVEESRFRVARLYFHENQLEESQKRLTEFIRFNPSIHQDEALLMLTKLARLDNRFDEAEELMQIFLKRFAWNSVASTELLAVVDMAVEKGHRKEALVLIEKFIGLPAAKKNMGQLLVKAAGIAASLQLYEKAEKYYKKVLEGGFGDVLDVSAMLGLADIFVRMKDYEGAKSWYVKMINRYPYERRAKDALYGLSEIFEKTSTNVSDVISLAIAAAKRDQNDPRAMTAIVSAARKLEEMDLTALALVQYERLSLLAEVKLAPGAGAPLSGGSPVAEAVLGSARCLVKMGDVNRAEKALRDLCNGLEKGPLLSEAAFMWSGIASERKQYKEALRRMEMVDIKTIRTELSANVAFEKMLLEVNTGQRSAESVDSILAKLADVPVDGQAEFVVKAYMTCFERLKFENNVDGMKRFLKAAATSPHSGYLPLGYFALSMGKTLFKQSGSAAFIDFMTSSDAIMKASGLTATNSVDEFLGLAIDLGDKIDKVSTFARVSTDES